MSVGFAGFRFVRQGGQWGVGVPFWAVAVLTVPSGAGWLLFYRTRLARRRVRDGLCPCCAYDLRGTPGRCPECGRGFPTAVLAA